MIDAAGLTGGIGTRRLARRWWRALREPCRSISICSHRPLTVHPAVQPIPAANAHLIVVRYFHDHFEWFGRAPRSTNRRSRREDGWRKAPKRGTDLFFV